MSAAPLRFWPDAAKASEAAAAARPQDSALYSSFCSVDVRHDFCTATGGAFEGLAIGPTPETRRRLDHWGVIHRPRADGFDLLADSSRRKALETLLSGVTTRFPHGLPPELEALLGPPLLFRIEVREPLFFNFTEVPLDVSSGNPALYLSNREVEPAGGDSYALVVDWGGAVFVPPPPDPEPVPPPPPPPSTPLAPSPSELLAPHVEDKPARWLATRGEIWRAKTELADLLEQQGKLPFALLSIHPLGSSGGAEPVQLVARDGEHLRPVRYTIRFAARTTFWRYVVASRTGDFDPAGFDIVDAAGGEPAGFTPEEPVTLPDGRTAVPFVSPSAYPIARRSTTAFALRGKSGSRGRSRLVVPRLPTPGAADSVVPDRSSGCGVYSDMYVFV